jgi:1-deoxy-D-xylulose-5-phosphate reductoisomerase
VHGLVHFEDGSVIAALSPPDMRSPIAHCLAWPERIAVDVPRLDLAAIGQLTFERADAERFPAIRIAREALDLGGWATNILSAANEIAVAAFLANQIGFLEIARIGEQAITEAAALKRREPASLDEAIDLDDEGRRIANRLVNTERNQRKSRE